jgi:hypothetical protein
VWQGLASLVPHEWAAGFAIQIKISISPENHCSTMMEAAHQCAGKHELDGRKRKSRGYRFAVLPA